jgi:3-methyl-2-oxobutanoate hydroxymethyltransferase
MNPEFTPKFVKKFMDGATVISDAAKAYIGEVRAGTFPADEHSFHSRSLRLYPAAVPKPVEDEPDQIGRIYAAPV